MSYIRIKWIKGHPYLYEQQSYRVGSKVKTKHIRYIGKFGFTGSGRFSAPQSLTEERKTSIDREIARLELGKSYPYEREILRQCLYHHSFPFIVDGSASLWLAEGYVRHTDKEVVVGFGVRRASSPFTWMHELGHLLELEDHILDEELKALRSAFTGEIEQSYQQAVQGGLEAKEVFINTFGRLIDLRVDFERGYRSLETRDREDIHLWLERAKGGPLFEPVFNVLFRGWVNAAYRLEPEEIYADSVAALIINPKKAFELHTLVGKKYLSKVYTKLSTHLEGKYKISLGRPKKPKPKK